jgi:hypothetical protein
MTNTTILLLVFSVVLAGLLSYYHYFYKAKSQSKWNWLLAFLRFTSYLLVFLLLINPIISRSTYEVEKTPLPLVVDNSKSIPFLEKNENNWKIHEQITTNKALQEKFDVQLFALANDLQPATTFDFSGNQTNIAAVADNLKQLYRNKKYPIVLLTDGNQTVGKDYVYNFQENTTVFPIVLGDTATVFDLKINDLNVNKYAFLKNKFPVEVFVQYNGTKAITADFAIQNGNQTIFKQKVSFTKDKKVQTISALLEATSVELQKYKAVISSGIPEKNTSNNTKNFAVEIIDQKSEIAIVSDIIHPDISALKRSIESNVMRKVNVFKPNEISSLEKINLVIFYQPTAAFKSIFETTQKANTNTFLITGKHTDFNFLNQIQDDFSFKMTNQVENYSPQFDATFNLFAQENIGFENFPPLENAFGTITAKKNQATLLQARIRTVTLENPLLAFAEEGTQRKAYLFGENIWKWRIETYLQKKTFTDFDLFMDKTIQFLSANSSKKSLIVSHESFYNSGETITISAQYFNKNYEFDDKAQLTIQVINNETKASKTYDFLKSSSNYEVNFDNLSKGNYSFVVKEKSSNATYKSSFEVLDFEMEKQFVNPDISRLQQLATNTNGELFHPNQIEALIEQLLKNPNFSPVEKEVTKKSPLIEWFWLLVLLVLTLGSEWFIRKYNGLL